MFKLAFSKNFIALVKIFLTIIIITKNQLAQAIAIDQSTTFREQSLFDQNQQRQINNNVNIDSIQSNLTKPTTTTGKPHLNNISFDPRRPIWNLAHMVNSIKELDYRLR